MDALRTVAALALILCYGGLSSQLIQDKHEIIENITTSASLTDDVASTTVSDIETPVVSLYCTTGKGILGVCLKRGYCDYGTSAVDFTVYAPRWYIKFCEQGEVCCPPMAQVQQTVNQEIDWEDDNSFDFDQNDYY